MSGACDCHADNTTAENTPGTPLHCMRIHQAHHPLHENTGKEVTSLNTDREHMAREQALGPVGLLPFTRVKGAVLARGRAGPHLSPMGTRNQCAH